MPHFRNEPPCTLSGFSLVGIWLVNNDRYDLKNMTGLVDADCRAISSSFCHFHSSSRLDYKIDSCLWLCTNTNHLMDAFSLLTLILILVAETRDGVVTGGGDVTNTRTDFDAIFGNDISNSVSDDPLHCFK